MIFVPGEFTEELGAMDLPGFGLQKVNDYSAVK